MFKKIIMTPILILLFASTVLSAETYTMELRTGLAYFYIPDTATQDWRKSFIAKMPNVPKPAVLSTIDKIKRYQKQWLFKDESLYISPGQYKDFVQKEKPEYIIAPYVAVAHAFYKPNLTCKYFYDKRYKDESLRKRFGEPINTPNYGKPSQSQECFATDDAYDTNRNGIWVHTVTINPVPAWVLNWKDNETGISSKDFKPAPISETASQDMSPTAQETCKIGTLKVVAGDVKVSGKIAQKGQCVQNGDRIVDGQNSTALITFADGTNVVLGSNTSYNIDNINLDSSSGKKVNFATTLLKGVMSEMSGKVVNANPDKFKLDTKTFTIGVRGTEFVVNLQEDISKESTYACTDGAISVTSKKDRTEVLIPKGKAVSTQNNKIGEVRDIDREKDLDPIKPALQTIGAELPKDEPTGFENSSLFNDLVGAILNEVGNRLKKLLGK